MELAAAPSAIARAEVRVERSASISRRAERPRPPSSEPSNVSHQPSEARRRSLESDTPARERALSAATSESRRGHDDAVAEAFAAVQMLETVRTVEESSGLSGSVATVLEKVEQAEAEAQAQAQAAKEGRRVTFKSDQPSSAETGEGGSFRRESAGRDAVTAEEGAGEDDGTPQAPEATAEKRSAGARLWSAAVRTARVLFATLYFVAREIAKTILVLLPMCVAFVAHRDEPLREHPEIWFCRPFYAALVGRLLAAVLLLFLRVPSLVEALPTRAAILMNAFDGWPADVVMYLCLTALFYFALPSAQPEANVWRRIREVEFLLGVNLWLAALVLTRWLLDALAELAFLNLKDGHFQERVSSAILSMRSLRLLFATGRAARTRAYHRRRLRESIEALEQQQASQRTRHGTQEWALEIFGAQRRRAHERRGRSRAQAPPQSPPQRAHERHRAEQLERLRAQQARPLPELSVLEDSAFSEVFSSVSDNMSLLRRALTSSNGRFSASIEEASDRAAKAFAALLGEWEHELAVARRTGVQPPVDPGSGGPPDTIPRARLVRWCVLATRRRGAAFEQQLVHQLETLLPAQHIKLGEFCAAAESVYREQKFVFASVASFDALNKHAHRFAVGIWALVLVLTGVFLVDWGVSFSDWVVPISSTFLSLSFLVGWLPYETIAGVLFVVASRPYDIGDRIMIANTGTAGDGCEVAVVSQIGLFGTRIISTAGDEQCVQNFVARKLAIVNLQRSRPPRVVAKIQIPSRTHSDQITQLLESIRAYVSSVPHDWVAVVGSTIAKPDYVNGLIEMSVYIQSAHKLIRDDLITHAKSQLFLFVHVYLQAAGIEFVVPPQDIVATVTERALRRRSVGADANTSVGGSPGDALRATRTASEAQPQVPVQPQSRAS